MVDILSKENNWSKREVYWNTRDYYKKLFNYDPLSAIWNYWHNPKDSSTHWCKSLMFTLVARVALVDVAVINFVKS